MDRYYLMGLLSLTAIAVTSLSFADTQEILGVYQENLTLYWPDGRKKDVREIKSEEIKGAQVLEITSRMMVRIIFRGEEMWLRASQLKFSLPVVAICPKKAPGERPDLVAPVSTGVGECK